MPPPPPDPTEKASPLGTEQRMDGRAARWTGQQQRRRAEFVTAALMAIKEHGAEVSTEQIAARAGVARTRLYRHFADAHALNEAIAERAESMLLEALAPVWDASASPTEIIRTGVTTHLSWLNENQQLYLYLVRHSVATATGDNVVNDVKRLVSNLVIRLLDEHVEAVGLDARITEPLSFGLVGFVDAAAAHWVSNPAGLDLEEMVDLLAGWVWSVMDGVLREVGLDIDPSLPLDLGTPTPGPGEPAGPP